MEYSDSWDGQTQFWKDIFNAVYRSRTDGSEETAEKILDNLIGPIIQSLDSGVQPVAQFALSAFLHENGLNGRR